MSTQLYAVTLTDLGTYHVTVAADTPKNAQAIAKEALLEEATTLPPEMRIIKREIDAVAGIAAEQPIRKFRVTGTYSLDFFITVPAATKDEAERHAKRIYESQPFPWEHETSEDRVQWHLVREVVS